jgi:hypothetical protein
MKVAVESIYSSSGSVPTPTVGATLSPYQSMQLVNTANGESGAYFYLAVQGPGMNAPIYIPIGLCGGISNSSGVVTEYNVNLAKTLDAIGYGEVQLQLYIANIDSSGGAANGRVSSFTANNWALRVTEID